MTPRLRISAPRPDNLPTWHMMIERPAFDVDVQGIDGATAIVVRGDMDVAAIEPLDAALE